MVGALIMRFSAQFGHLSGLRCFFARMAVIVDGAESAILA